MLYMHTVNIANVCYWDCTILWHFVRHQSHMNNDSSLRVEINVTNLIFKYRLYIDRYMDWTRYRYTVECGN